MSIGESYFLSDMDRFVALPVGQGDAFFFQHGDFTALVDGGRSVHQIPSLFSTYLNARHANVVVCTHNDADHANGVLGFLQSDLECDEVWLPGLWGERLSDLLEAPEEFVRELVDNIAETQNPPRDRETDRPARLAELGDQFVDTLSDRSHESVSMEVLSRPLEGIDEDFEDGFMEPNSNFHRIPWWHWWRLFPDDRNRLLHEAFSSAQRIRDIATSCVHRNVPIRWLWYDEYGPSKDPYEGKLIPLNAVRIKPKRSSISPFSALRYLSLLKANRSSLVFCSPGENDWPGIVFTGDSDLRFSADIPWRTGMIVTAPHHGSEANRNAYCRVDRDMEDANDLLWIRSDGNFKTRPGPSYCARPAGRRFCTLCRNALDQKQAVELSVHRGRWALYQSVHRCTCHCP